MSLKVVPPTLTYFPTAAWITSFVIGTLPPVAVPAGTLVNLPVISPPTTVRVPYTSTNLSRTASTGTNFPLSPKYPIATWFAPAGRAGIVMRSSSENSGGGCGTPMTGGFSRRSGGVKWWYTRHCSAGLNHLAWTSPGVGEIGLASN